MSGAERDPKPGDRFYLHGEEWWVESVHKGTISLRNHRYHWTACDLATLNRWLSLPSSVVHRAEVAE